jgi:hypothetical protein
MGHGLNVLTTVTWSRNENDSNGASNTYAANGSGSSQDNYDRAAEWGRAIIDTPWRWTSAVNYVLPFARGGNRVLVAVAGGWNLNFQTTLQSGFPLAISQSNLNSIIGTSVQRPNATGVSPQTRGNLEDRLVHYINAAAFTQAPAYTYGNVSRTIPVRGPGQANCDLSIFKSYAFREKLKAQFRFEVFNLTNTPLFNGMNTTFGSATFGQITNQANYPRIVQLGVRFSY